MKFVKYRNGALRYFITDKNILRQLPSFIIFAAREWRLQMSDIKRWISKWPPITISNPCTVWGPDRVRKTSSARQHCWPDFFCISERLGQDTKVQHWHKVIIFWNYFIRNYWVSCFQRVTCLVFSENVAVQKHLYHVLSWHRSCLRSMKIYFLLSQFPTVSCQFSSGLIPFTFGDVPLNEVVITGKNGIYRFSIPNSKNSKS